MRYRLTFAALVIAFPSVRAAAIPESPVGRFRRCSGAVGRTPAAGPGKRAGRAGQPVRAARVASTVRASRTWSTTRVEAPTMPERLPNALVTMRRLRVLNGRERQ